VDDGSTDNTKEIVLSYDDERMTYIQHDNNKGGSAARNTGIETSNGEFIAFIDSDDEWRPEKLSKQLSHLKSRSNEWVATYCRIYVDNSPVKGFLLNDENKVKEGGKELIDDILTLELQLGGASTLLVRKKAIKEIDGFDTDFQRHQDWEFCIRLLKKGKITYVDERLVVKHSTEKPPASILEQAKEDYFVKFSDEIESLEEDGIDVVGIHNIHLSKRYFKQGDIRKGTELLFSARLKNIAWSDILIIIWNIFQSILLRSKDMLNKVLLSTRYNIL
jgi:glycosyltransferase involved in cell wall biosynthesis